VKFQRMLSNGDWVEEENIDRFIDEILKREPTIAPRYNRTPMKTKEAVFLYLSDGNEINYDSDWYAKIRMHREEPQIDWSKVERERRRQEKKDYLATHDVDWYEDF